jgi:hypothetical protein
MTSLHSESRRTSPSSGLSGQTDRRPLNAMDRGMVTVNRALRSRGLPEFSTQALVWLSERIDVARLRIAIIQLSRRHPVLSARLCDSRKGPSWQIRLGAFCLLQEESLPSTSPQAVLQRASELLATPGDPTQDDPIRFVLLRRPDGRDVIVIQYSHVLMDNGDALPLLRELDILYGTDCAAEVRPSRELPDFLAEHLRRIPFGRRLRAALRTLNVRFRKLPRNPTVLGHPVTGTSLVKFRILTRSIDAPAVSALENQLIETCGFPCLSMAILASVFRTMQRLKAHRPEPVHDFIAGIGIDLCPRGVRRPIFQTLASVIPLHVRSEALLDRDASIRQLNDQLRERLQHDADLGTIQLASFFQQPGVVRQRFTGWSVRRLLRSGYSLWFAYFGPVDALGERFCGSPIEEMMYTASTWPPMGVTFLANRFRGRLLFQLTYVPECVSEELASDFLDGVIRDLTGTPVPSIEG